MAKIEIMKDEFNGALFTAEFVGTDLHIRAFGDTSLEELVAAPSLKGYNVVIRPRILKPVELTTVGYHIFEGKDSNYLLVGEMLGIAKKAEAKFTQWLEEGPSIIMSAPGSRYSDVLENFYRCLQKIRQYCKTQANLAGKAKDFKLSKAWRKEYRRWWIDNPEPIDKGDGKLVYDHRTSWDKALWKSIQNQSGISHLNHKDLVNDVEYVGKGRYRIVTK